MHIRRLLPIIAALYLLPTILVGQVLSVQLKVRESRLFGLKGERVAQLELSNQNRVVPLTSDNVNAGPGRYFIFRPVGDWVIDADFVSEEIPKLTMRQDTVTLTVTWTDEIRTDSLGSLLLVGFPGPLKLHEPFAAGFQLADSVVRSWFLVPQELWPGYPALVAATQAVERATSEKWYRDAITACEAALRSEPLQIFPQVHNFSDRRIQIFDLLQSESLSIIAGLAGGDARTLKDKIARLDDANMSLQFVLDSVASASLHIAATDSAVRLVLDRAFAGSVRARALRDSLQLALDDHNVRWIMEGSVTGKNGDRYLTMIEALAYACSSIDFADTNTVPPFKVCIPLHMKERMTRNDLDESFGAFVRQCGERLRRQGTLFSQELLNNLRRDTASFPQPYYAMLKAIDDTYGGFHAGARESIAAIFRTCCDPELTARFDQLRVFLDMRQHTPRPDVRKLLDEAAAAENAGSMEAASELYRDASRLAPELAYISYRWGKLFERNGDPIRAQTFFERAYQTDTLYLSAYRDACLLFRRASNYKAMIEVLTVALNRGNDFWEINFDLGLACLGDNDPSGAIKHLERALDLNPNDYVTSVQLGLAQQAAKNFQKAREYFNRAVFIDPIRPEAVDYLNKLNELQKNAR
jgi:tetratricopeptide (TPR) repeat protein